MKTTLRTLPALTAFAAALALPRLAAACATCFGAADSPMTQGMNNAILMLIGVVGLVYVGIGRLIWDFRKRSKKLADAEKAAQAPQLRLIHGGKR